MCAGLLRVQGDSPRARALLEKEIEILKATLGEHDPRYARGLQSLAWTYRLQNAFAQYEPLQQKAVAVVREVYGENHREYWSALSNLLDYYARIKRAPREVVEPMRSRLREIEKAIRDSKEPTLEHAQWLMLIAREYRQPSNPRQLAWENRDQVAEEYVQPALAIYKETVGETAPQYIGACRNSRFSQKTRVAPRRCANACGS